MDMKRVEEIEKWYNRGLSSNTDFVDLLQMVKQQQKQLERYEGYLKEIIQLKEEYTMGEYPEQVDYVAEKALEQSHE